MLEPNSLSRTARALRRYLAEALAMSASRILIGHPEAVLAEARQEPDAQHLGLFVYRTEIDGFPADGAHPAPVYLRLHCLLSTFSSDETGDGGQTTTAGEMDLRLLGGVVAALHQQPILDVEDEQGRARLQVIPLNLDLEALNQLWANQGGIASRPSMAYELALLPLPLGQPADRRPRVGSLGVGVTTAARDNTVAPAIQATSPSRLTPRGDGDWHPLLATRDASGKLSQALVAPESALPLRVEVLVAGEPESVELAWEVWDRAEGWRALPEPALALVPPVRHLDAGAFALAVRVALPLTGPGQAALHARRAGGGERSDPVLVSIHPEEAP